MKICLIKLSVYDIYRNHQNILNPDPSTIHLALYPNTLLIPNQTNRKNISLVLSNCKYDCIIKLTGTYCKGSTDIGTIYIVETVQPSLFVEMHLDTYAPMRRCSCLDQHSTASMMQEQSYNKACSFSEDRETSEVSVLLGIINL